MHVKGNHAAKETHELAPNNYFINFCTTYIATLIAVGLH